MPGSHQQLRNRKPAPAIRWRGKGLTVPDACDLAVREHQAGNFRAVVELYNLMLAQAPGYAEGHNNRGAALHQLQRYEEALASYDLALAVKPDYVNAHHNRGATLKKLSRMEEALASYDRAIALNPAHAEAHNNRGVLLQEMRRHDEALASYDRAIALKPGHAEAHNNRGVVLVAKGDMAEAEKMYLKAIELKPDFTDPLFNLVNIRNYQTADNPEVSRIRALLGQPRITPEDREHYYFTLGKIYDDCGQYDEAFGYFRQANQIRNARAAYNPVLVERTTSATIEVFTREFLAQHFEYSSASALPVFIVGMPRSGTTLLASILSNHPEIATAGELSTIADFASQLQTLTGSAAPYPAAVRQLTPAVAAGLISRYEQQLQRGIPPEKRLVIDKNPLNFRHLGLIAKLFPRARIIHCTRDRVDTCLSNFFQRFPMHMDYSFDLRNIAHFYGEYARLMEHWRTISTLNLLEISYEDMVLHTEPAARRMLEFLGVEWSELCLTPQSNPCVVDTASQWQVRQPIYLRALGRWRHYEKHLGLLTGGRPV